MVEGRKVYHAAAAMTAHLSLFYLIAAVLWLMAMLQGLFLLRSAVRLLLHVRRANRESPRLASGRWKYEPRAVVFLPCCGVDEKLHRTVESLGRQDYADYHVIFTFESAADPAYAAVTSWIADWKNPPTQRIIAGLATNRGQKIHNLLAALDRVPADREVFVFLDSDAVPASDWLGTLIAPLADPQVGAATGFRWYSADGGWVNGIRSCWNAASLTLITDPKLSFVWGGSTAVRRETFERLAIAQAWDRALSDDYQVTRAMHEGRMKIQFVPRAIVPSHEPTTFRNFWTFARRQLVITRVCGPALWRAALILCLNFILGGTAVAVLFFAALWQWIPDHWLMWPAFAAWMAVIGVACINAAIRQFAVRQVLKYPDVTWRDFAWDVGGVNLSGMLHLSLLFASLTSRSFVWRNTVYELISPDETKILGRLDRSPNLSPPIHPTTIP